MRITIRVTRPSLYDGNPTDVTARQGYYVYEKPEFFGTNNAYQMAEVAAAQAFKQSYCDLGREWLLDVQVPGFDRVIRCARIPKDQNTCDPNNRDHYRWVASELPVRELAVQHA